MPKVLKALRCRVQPHRAAVASHACFSHMLFICCAIELNHLWSNLQLALLSGCIQTCFHETDIKFATVHQILILTLLNL